jgi:hypothetical protein
MDKTVQNQVSENWAGGGALQINAPVAGAVIKNQFNIGATGSLSLLSFLIEPSLHLVTNG